MSEREGALVSRTLPDGRILDVVPQLWGNYRLVLSPDAEAQWYLDGF